MKKLSFVLRAIILCALLAIIVVGCWNAADPLKKIELGEPVTADVNTLEGFSMEVIGEPTNGAAKVKVVNSTDKKYSSDVLLAVNVEKDGVWYGIEYDLPENAAFISDAYLFRQNSETEIFCSWGGRYGPLPKGHYRILFAVYEELYVGEPHMVSAEFYLE